MQDFIGYAKAALKHNSEGSLDYLTGERGLCETVIDEFDLGYCPRYSARQLASPMLRGRIIFPIYDVYGRPIAVTSRLPRGGKCRMKYFNTPFEKSLHWYGLNWSCRDILEAGRVIIVEGNMDALALYQAGVTNVVASMGAALSERRVLLILRYANAATLVPDGDRAGVRTMKSLGTALSRYGIVTSTVPVPGAKDAAELLHGETDCRGFLRTLTGSPELDLSDLRGRLDNVSARTLLGRRT